MIPSCCTWKVVTLFGKEHVNWSSISGVMIGRCWTIKSNQPILNFPNSIFQLLPIITPLLLDQFTCSLPKNVTTFYGQQDGIIHFCLSPHKIGVFGNINLHFDKKKMDFFKLDFSTSSYHKSINIGPIGIFFTKNEHYFSPAFQICQERCNFFNN